MDKKETVRELLLQGRKILGENRKNDVRLLLEKALGMSREKLAAAPDLEPEEKKKEEFFRLLRAAGAGEPVQYLTGIQNFWGRDFFVDGNVLIPRNDTEVLVETVLKKLPDREKEYDFLDLGTGSGILAVTLALEYPRAVFDAVDISGPALETATKNAAFHGVEERITFHEGDLFRPVSFREYDVVVSNPPYVTSAEMSRLPPDVRQEPVNALWGGPDGLVFYRFILEQGFARLKKGGMLFLETGAGQGQDLLDLAGFYGYGSCEIIKDYGNRDRVAFIRP